MKAVLQKYLNYDILIIYKYMYLIMYIYVPEIFQVVSGNVYDLILRKLINIYINLSNEFFTLKYILV